MKILRFLVIPFLSMVRSVAADSAPTDLFLLIGQSNMAGRGVMTPEDKRSHPRVFVFTKERIWSPASDPLHFDKASAGVGLGSSFAWTLSEQSPRTRFGLVPAAVGGTSLDQWQVGGELYSQALSRARAALATGGRLRGMLWHQGESDSRDLEKAKVYAAKLSVILTQFRSDLGVRDCPIVVGELGRFVRPTSDGKWPGVTTVNLQLASLPLSLVRTTFVPSEGLDHKGDSLHFDRAALREFGRRYAYAFMLLDNTWRPLASPLGQAPDTR